MSNEPTNKSLLRGVEHLHDAAVRGDSSARSKLVDLSSAASRGDHAALAAINTLAAVRFQKRFPEQWEKAGAMEALISQGDPDATAWARSVQEKAKSGDAQNRNILGMLNAHKDLKVASAWAEPEVSGDNDNTRTRNVSAMILGRTPNSHANARALAAVGAVPQEAKAVTRRFLPVTPDVEQKLIAMMMQGAMSRGGATRATSAASAQRPEASICAQARSAVARNSPAAPGLVAQCNAASGRQVLAPMAAYVAQNTGPVALGVYKPPPVALGFGIVHMTAAEQAAATANQGICDYAASAVARNSPAAPGLVKQCAAQRAANINNGMFYTDKFTTNDPSFRVALTGAGDAVIAKNPKMAQFRASLPVSQQRGFTMAMAVRSGKMADGFVAFVKPGLVGDPELLKGFLDGMAM